MSVQLQIRADIEYLANSWKTPKVYPINGDISKDKAFAKLPVLLSYIKPEESKQAPQGNGKIQKWRIELFLAYVKLPDGCDPTTKSHEYDEQVSEMSELLDKLHTGLTKQYINGVKNPIANARGYIADQPLTFLETYFEFGSNKYMAVRATWSMTVNVANCFDCTDFVSGTFDQANVPPNDSNPIGGSNGQKGDMLYWSDTLNKWVRFNIGADGTVLKAVAGLPSWEDETGGGITEETDPIFEAWEATNGANLINHLSDTNNPHDVTKNQVGLGNVDNTSDADKPISSATQTALDSKQDSLGYTPESVSNKTDTMAGNTASSVKYLSAKGVYDWVMSLGFITNVAAALGYTPENVANKSTSVATDQASDTKYPSVKAVYDWATGLFVQKNGAITGATKTKVTYDSKGLVTAGSDATTADIADSTNKRYVTDAQQTVIGNTSGTNTGDETNTTIKTKLGAASASNDGYLISSDWSRFDAQSKHTLVAAYSGQTTVTLVTIGTKYLLQGLAMPLNTFIDGDILYIKARAGKFVAGSTVRSIYLNIDTSLGTGGTQIGTYTSPSSGSNYLVPIERGLIVTSTGLYGLDPTVSAVTDMTGVVGGAAAPTINFGVDTYLNVLASSTSAIAPITIYEIEIWRYRP